MRVRVNVLGSERVAQRLNAAGQEAEPEDEVEGNEGAAHQDRCHRVPSTPPPSAGGGVPSFFLLVTSSTAAFPAPALPSRTFPPLPTPPIAPSPTVTATPPPRTVPSTVPAP